MQELFLELVKLSLIGSSFALAVMAVRLIFPKAPKWIFCVLWGIVALRLIVPISIESDLSLIPDRLASGQIITNVGSDYIGDVDIIYESNASYSNAVEAGRQPIYSNDGYYVVTERDSLEAPKTVGETVYPVLSWVWFAGMVLMLIYTAVSYILLKLKMEEATLLRDNIWQCEQADSPFVLGIIRPRIYLPYSVTESDMENVIAHEQAHIRRKDHWWKPIGFLLLSIHWFNPVMWLAYILLCRDIEAACDEKVIKHMEKDEMRAYSTALLHCSVHRRRIAACPLAFGEVGVKERIKRVMNYKKPGFWIIILTVAASIIAGILLLTDPIQTVDGVHFSFDAEDIENFEMYHFNGLPSSAEKKTITEEQDIYSLYQLFKGLTLQIKDTEDILTASVTSFRFNLTDGSSYELIYCGYGVKNGELKSPTDSFAYFTTADIGWNWRWLNEDLEAVPVDESELPGYADDEYSYPKGKYCDDLIPGTIYVPYQCIYMNPLSSYAAMGGDSGCKYIVGEDYFATIWRDDSNFINVTHPDLDTTADNPQNIIEVSKWEWQEFPYSDEEWADLYRPGNFNTIVRISDHFDEMYYQPLAPDKFLLKLDESLWIVELSIDSRVGTYLWSIYSLVPESAMGFAQWEFAPMLSSRLPVFRFKFDMEYTSIIASCDSGMLMDWESQMYPSGSVMTYEDGHALYWDPTDEDGSAVASSKIFFSVMQGDTLVYQGNIYIEGSSGSNDRRIYNASLIGAGLHLEQNIENEGAIITSLDSVDDTDFIVKYDLTAGKLEVPVEELENYVFYTNSERISVTVKSEQEFKGEITLLDVSQNHAQILFGKVDTKEERCLFQNITSARLYRIECSGLDGCTVIISE